MNMITKSSVLVALCLTLTSLSLPALAQLAERTQVTAGVVSGGVNFLPVKTVNASGSGLLMTPAGSLNLKGSLALPQSPIPVSPAAMVVIKGAELEAPIPVAGVAAVPATQPTRALGQDAAVAAETGQTPTTPAHVSGSPSRAAAPLAGKINGILSRAASAVSAWTRGKDETASVPAQAWGQSQGRNALHSATDDRASPDLGSLGLSALPGHEAAPRETTHGQGYYKASWKVMR